ncbi:MAG: aminoacetone oxidase family FAD-binding enzyme [Opitutales bacterium]
MSQARRIAVIGAGPAGLYAALTAGECNPAAEVIILDDSGDPWSRLRKMEGLVGVDCFDAETFTEAFLNGGRELLGPFYQWTPDDQVEWLAKRGLAVEGSEGGPLRAEDPGAVAQVLQGELDREEILLKAGERVIHADASSEGNRFWLTLADNSTVEADALIIATGGMLNGGAPRLIEELGHTVRPPVPAMFHLQTADERFRGLAGVTIPHTAWRIPGIDGAEAVGPTEFQPWGFGGTAVLALGARAADRLAKVRYRFVAEVNWLAALNQPGKALAEQARRYPRQRLGSEPFGGLPERLWAQLIQGAGASLDDAWGGLEKSIWGKLQQALTRCPVEVHRKRLYHGESAVSGGVALGEVHLKTMGSRRVDGLFFAGQVLDYHALPGGFNLHAEWLTGRTAGRSAALGVPSSN